MEATVDKLEAMFLKSDADLEYTEKRLKLDFIMKTAESGCTAEENPTLMLERLRAQKAKHTTLCSQVKEITDGQTAYMDSIRANLCSIMKLIQHFQHTTDLEVKPLTSPELLSSFLNQPTTGVNKKELSAESVASMSQ